MTADETQRLHAIVHDIGFDAAIAILEKRQRRQAAAKPRDVGPDGEMVIRPGETARDAALRICRADKAAGYGVPWYMQELLVHIMTTGEVQP